MGHVSVRVNDTSYSFNAGGMDIRSFGEYMGLNNFRSAHGLVLGLPQGADTSIVEILSNYGKPYNYAPNNCTTPISDAIYQLFGVASGAGTPQALEVFLRNNFSITGYNFYPASK